MTEKSDSDVNKQYYRKSASGRYTVAKCICGARSHYLAWRGDELAGIFADYAAAQACCVRDGEQSRRVA